MAVVLFQRVFISSGHHHVVFDRSEVHFSRLAGTERV